MHRNVCFVVENDVRHGKQHRFNIGKKVRKRNFTPTEVVTLTEKVDENQEVIQSKLTNTVTDKKKSDVWSTTVKIVNSVGNENKKNQMEKPEQHYKERVLPIQEREQQTGGGTPLKEPSLASTKIIEFFGDTPQFTVLGDFETGERVLKCTSLRFKR